MEKNIEKEMKTKIVWRSIQRLGLGLVLGGSEIIGFVAWD